MEKQRIRVYLSQYIIDGTIHGLEQGVRVTDYLNAADETFIPLTNVTIFDGERNKIKEENYLCLSLDKILFVEEKNKS